jgi:hypothetical protein
MVGGEGFCIENPLTPTGWSRREADIANHSGAALLAADPAPSRARLFRSLLGGHVVVRIRCRV